ncbi:MAG: phosphoribosylglycinamide formyltransferase [Candidatus Tantalella remota]|nr:phosphoribosylglycinamide formyltransferase [Candidatus Tantalella remota]
MNIAVFVSGNGSNLQALIDAEAKGDLAGGRIVLVVSDHRDAYALQRAADAGVEIFVQEAGGFATREEYDKAISEELKEKNIDMIVLAGLMRLLSPSFVEEYEGRILNIHPALLPSFKGVHGIRDAYEHGVKMTGVTVHIVSAEMDDGPIIAQVSVPVLEDETLDSLEAKIHAEEHKLYPEAVSFFVQGKIKVDGRKVNISKT